MSKLIDCLSSIAGVAVHACWEQWRSLYGERDPAHATVPAMIDPEALVLASLALRGEERRLDDMLLAIGEESHLISVQRTKTLATWFPDRVGNDLAWFAGVACEAGDARWRSLLGDDVREARGRLAKPRSSPSLRFAAAFMLRMRSGLGVGIKADLIACLEGIKTLAARHAQGITVAELHQVLGYSKASTRTALEEMVRGGVVDREKGRPARFRIGGIYFQDLEGRQRPGVAMTPPPWGYAAQALAILIACGDLLADAEVQRLPEVVQASRLRDLHDRFEHCWSWFGVEPVDGRVFRGTSFVDGFHIVLSALRDWADRRL